MIIFSYTSSPQVKILQNVLGELLFFTHTVHRDYVRTYVQIQTCNSRTWNTLPPLLHLTFMHLSNQVCLTDTFQVPSIILYVLSYLPACLQVTCTYILHSTYTLRDRRRGATPKAAAMILAKPEVRLR